MQWGQISDRMDGFADLVDDLLAMRARDVAVKKVHKQVLD